MVGVHAPDGSSLENRSPTLFLVGGVLLVGYATFNGIDAFTGTVYVNIENVFGPTGFIFGFVGLLGLYPELADRSPKLATVGAVCAGLGAAGFSVFVVANLGQLVGVLSGEPPAWAAAFVLLAGFGMIPGFVAFSVANLRDSEQSRTVGLLLLAPPAIFGVMVTASLLGSSPQWALFLISAGQALAHLSIGFALRTGRTRTEREITTSDVTVS